MTRRHRTGPGKPQTPRRLRGNSMRAIPTADVTEWISRNCVALASYRAQGRKKVPESQMRQGTACAAKRFNAAISTPLAPPRRPKAATLLRRQPSDADAPTARRLHAVITCGHDTFRQGMQKEKTLLFAQPCAQITEMNSSLMLRDPHTPRQKRSGYLMVGCGGGWCDWLQLATPGRV